MKNKLAFLFIVVFFLICIIPVLLMPLSAKDGADAENRSLADRPALLLDDKINPAFFDEISAYTADHFYFRSQLISLNSFLKDKIFSTSSQKKVIAGREDWLFFVETTDDFLGLNNFSQHELNNIIKTLEIIDTYASSQGKDFIFMPCPNKNSVYAKYMPPQYLKSNEPSNLDRLLAGLKEKDIDCIDIKELFSAEGDDLYHKRDSHWNNKGALLAANELLSKLNKPESQYEEAAVIIEKNWLGDLDKMLYPSQKNKFDEQITYDYSPNFSYTSKFRTAEDILIQTINEQGSGSLLMFRDSFGNALLPFLAEEFSTLYYSRAVPYNINLLSAMNHDSLVIQIVERNLSNLLYSAPFLSARQLSPPEAEEQKGEDSLFSRRYLGHLHLYGELDEKYMADENEICLVVEAENESIAFETFPVFEKKLLNSSEEGRGFSLYINEEMLPKTDFHVYLTISNNSHNRKTEVLGRSETLLSAE